MSTVKLSSKETKAARLKTRKASIAIMAHNEEGNMAALLERICGEEPPGIEIDQIVVVSSGSTDRTDEIVHSYEDRDHRVKLVVQDERRGKCAAINLFLSQCAPNQFIVLLSGDILPDPGAVSAMLLPLLKDQVGMTGGRPVPVNNRNEFFGFVCHLIWEVHHQIALQSPKLGEAVAFKNLVQAIPEDLAVDEAALEAMILNQGLKLAYCPDAVIRNRGPDNLHDFLKQRRRIQVGHIDLRDSMGYEVSTFGLSPSIKALLAVIRWTPRSLCWTVLACFLVFWGRVLGVLDSKLMKKRHAIWDIAESTKGSLSKTESKDRP